ncbi:Selenoprotein N [Galemys pyrenaicus]|uniref:Selenoprotein N n=1 Tax=Galemys pyrenaicus TaxID=202257 RepID=A0A8J5ZSR6_GALPY|nr:Selenoprotein N [Galemys pyrenaicus]
MDPAQPPNPGPAAPPAPLPRRALALALLAALLATAAAAAARAYARHAEAQAAAVQVQPHGDARDRRPETRVGPSARGRVAEGLGALARESRGRVGPRPGRGVRWEGPCIARRGSCGSEGNREWELRMDRRMGVAERTRGDVVHVALLPVRGPQTAQPLPPTQESALKALGTEGLFLFSSLDADRDMYISPEEFKPIAEKLTGSTPVGSYEEEEELPPDPSEETLTVEAQFQPLLLESMTKSRTAFLGVSHLALSGLLNWTAAASPSAVFAARHFRPFLPPRGQVELGQPWWIIPSELSIFTGYLSNNRFYPPPPKGKEVIIHRLLSMFHPRPFVKTRFAPQGAVACLTAVSDFYYTVMFRIHAEFQLSEPPNFPFWFLPGQFTGHIILSKDATHVRDFRLFVPNHRSLNVDMEWLYGASESSNMEVDIGYVPQMELKATGPSVPSVILDEDGNMVDSRLPSGEPLQFVFEEIKWQQELSWEEAARRLEVAMYPFKKVRLGRGDLAGGSCGSRWHRGSGFCSGRTLRETVLESSPILALLNESFVSTWSLVKELEDLQNNQENPAQQELARLHLEKYSFPVEMMICLPNGTVVHHINANYFLDITSMKTEDVKNNVFSFSSTFEDPSTATYLQFLREGLQRGLPLLQP